MTKRALITAVPVLIGSICIIAGCPFQPGEEPETEQCPEWGYEGSTGPDAWGSLCTYTYTACEEGVNQSPINITDATTGDGSSPAFTYAPQVYQVINNGETIRANAPAGNRITLDGVDYDLKQFHFHLPSEHTVDGVSYSMEMHLVHADIAGNNAVVSLLIEPGSANGTLAPIFSNLPPETDDTFTTPSIDLNNTLPVNRTTFRYSGSLTTPPCTEGVRWSIMQETIQLSQEQIDAFDDVFDFDNNRPLQPLGDREITIIE